MLICIIIFAGFDYQKIYNSTGQRDLSCNELDVMIKQAATFSSSKNVIVIGIDMLQGTVAEKTFQKYPEFLEKFDGFTVFTRAFSSFPMTTYSRPTIISGKEYSTNNNDYEINTQNAIADSFLTDMQSAGVVVNGLGVYLYEKIRSMERTNSVEPWMLYRWMFAAAGARLTGYYITDYATFIRNVPSVLSPGFNQSVWTKFGSRNDHEALINNISVDEERENAIPKCLFFWDYTLHDPILFTRQGDTLEVVSKNGNFVYFFDENYLLNETAYAYDNLNCSKR
jgi:hypothetical protein